MSVPINSSEVLHHLNNYGIHSVDEETLKFFIKDLKKLIKYEQRKHNSVDHKASSHFQTQMVSNLTDFNGIIKNQKLKLVDCKKEEKNRNQLSSVSQSRSKSRSQSRNKYSKHSDPVELYQYYQSVWEHFKLPGENDYSELRKMIRKRLMVK